MSAEPPVAAPDHADRVRGLRNLRDSYGNVQSAVGFWESLHGEDLIEVYAALLVERQQDKKRLGLLIEVAQDFLRAEYPTGTLHPADAAAARLERTVGAVLAGEKDTTP